MMRVLFFVLLSATVAAGDHVNLEVHQGSTDLDINCTVSDPSGQNFSHVVSLILTRVADSGDIVLATLYSYDKGNPVSNAQDATVSGYIQDDTRSESFLAISLKNTPQNQAAAEIYACNVIAVGLDNLPIALSAKEEVFPVPGEPNVFSDPEVIQLGLTRELTITCSLDDLASVNMSTPMSVSLLRIHERTEQLLSSVTVTSPVSVTPGVMATSVDGQIGTGQGNSSTYIKLSWPYPKAVLTGQYICQIMGEDAGGNPRWIQNSTNVTVVEPPRDQLVDRIEVVNSQLQQQSQLAQHQAEQLQQQSSQLQQQSHQLQEQRDQIQNMTNQIQNLSSQLQEFSQNATIIYPRISGCDDLSLRNGSMVVSLQPLDDQGRVDVLCEFNPQGKTWTVFQKRFDGSVDFYRTFKDYENGFGDKTKEFWMGLKTLRRLVQTGSYELQVDMVSNEGRSYTRNYPNFSIGPAPGYKLSVSGYDDGGKGLTYHSGMNFTTYDSENARCAQELHGGFWYNDCGYVNLNGAWGATDDYTSMSWYEIHNRDGFWMKDITMKFRLKT